MDNFCGEFGDIPTFLWIVLWGESPQNVKELVEAITLFRGQSNLVELDS